eukprot:2075165-Rhodomonas_salina.1
MVNKGYPRYASLAYFSIYDYFDPDTAENRRTRKAEARAYVKRFNSEWKVYIVTCLHKQSLANKHNLNYLDRDLIDNIIHAIFAYVSRAGHVDPVANQWAQLVGDFHKLPDNQQDIGHLRKRWNKVMSLVQEMASAAADNCTITAPRIGSTSAQGNNNNFVQ